jgi:hypothetical protein
MVNRERQSLDQFFAGYDLIVSARQDPVDPFQPERMAEDDGLTLRKCGHQKLHRGTPRKRKFGAVVQAAHFFAVEPLLLDFEEGPQEQLWRQFFDCKSERVCGAVKSSVSGELTIELSASSRK